ncbi:hypothetical protein, partial [Streptomyces sp. SM14]|uniref:hypothetical protein n=2 Tax=unclassified Streptomyces TaxID=2593676 RepID=UPI001CA5D3CA
GYWCETVARCPGAAGEWHLGGRRCGDPGAAVGWMRGQALRLAHALDHRHDTGLRSPAQRHPLGSHHRTDPGDPDRAGSDPATVFRRWADDAAYHHFQKATLAAGRPVSVNAHGPDRICGAAGRDVEVLYSLSARPIHRLVGARRLLRAL